MKKWLGSFMIVVMLFSAVLTGCGTGSSTEKGASTADSGKTADTSVAKESPKPSEPVKISVFVGGSSVPAPDKDPILQQLNKNLNMNMEFNVATSDYDSQLNVKIAGGTPPDLFAISKTQLDTYAKQGILLDIGKYLDKMPNIKKTYTASDLNKGKVDGTMYALAARPGIPMATYWIRKDWLDKLGLKPPTTLEELKAVAIAFTNKDPDGNGKKDTYGITGIAFSSFEPIFAAYGVSIPGTFMIKDNKVAYSTVQPEMKAALSYIKDLLDNGAVDPEIMANQGLKDQEKAFKGQAGILYRNWGELTKDNYVQDYKKINPNAEWLQLGALTGPGGKFMGSWDQGSTPGRVAIPKSLEKSPEKLNKVLEYLNYITEPGDGQNIVNYGVEGTHWKKENGKIVALPAISEMSYAWVEQLTYRNEKEYLSVKFPKQASYIEFAAQQPRIPTYNQFVSTPAGVVTDDKNRYENEETTKFIYGKRPLSEFDAFVKTLDTTYKLPLYIQEADKALKTLGYIK